MVELAAAGPFGLGPMPLIAFTLVFWGGIGTLVLRRLLRR